MGRPRKAGTTHVRIAEFASDELGLFVNDLRDQIKLKASPVDVLGALVIAGRGLPPTVMRELVELYKAEASKHAPDVSDRG